MTKKELSDKYNIPPEILDEYGKKKGEYTDEDIERLSEIMTLKEAGFSCGEIKRYMELSCGSEKSECICMLNSHRSYTLNEIHEKEKQIEYLDYLRYKIKNGK